MFLKGLTDVFFIFSSTFAIFCQIHLSQETNSIKYVVKSGFATENLTTFLFPNSENKNSCFIERCYLCPLNLLKKGCRMDWLKCDNIEKLFIVQTNLDIWKMKIFKK